MNAADWWNVILNFASILAAVLLAVWLSPKIQSAREDKLERERVLTALMTTRINAEHPDMQEAMNTFPFVFRKYQPALDAFKAFVAATNVKLSGDPEIRFQQKIDMENKYRTLIARVGETVGFKISEKELLDFQYSSSDFKERKDDEKKALKAVGRMADALEKAFESVGK